MPEQQYTFEGELVAPSAYSDFVECAGGCDRNMLRTYMATTPRGLMCDSCVHDNYETCADCGTMLEIDEYGICDDGVEDSSRVLRCRPCHERIYTRCFHCGRYTRIDANTSHDHPDAPGESLCDGCYHALYFVCECCERTQQSRNRTYTPEDGSFCRACYDLYFIQCVSCCNTYYREEFNGDVEDRCCSSCFGRVDTWRIRDWDREPGSYDSIGSTRGFGVEIETANCRDHRRLHGNTTWGCVYECSTPGLEFVSPVLHGDNGLEEIRDFCRAARGRNWSVDSSCGLHIHLDLSGDSSDECLKIAYAYRKTYEMWKRFVRRDRAENRMCGSPQYELSDVRTAEHIEDFAERRDRFEFVNWRSFLRHGSFEVRMYQGTLGAREICNWIKLHAQFMDAVKNVSFDEQDDIFGNDVSSSWKGMWDLIENTDLQDYWYRRCKNSRMSSGYEFPALASNGDWAS